MRKQTLATHSAGREMPRAQKSLHLQKTPVEPLRGTFKAPHVMEIYSCNKMHFYISEKHTLYDCDTFPLSFLYLNIIYKCLNHSR